MCLKEFCCWSSPVEGEGSMDHRPQRESSPPKKTSLGVNYSDVKGAAAAAASSTGGPLKGNSNGGHKPYTPPPKKEVTAAEATDGERKAPPPPPPQNKNTTSGDVHPSKQMATHDRALPKGGVLKDPSANYVTDTTDEQQQPPTQIEHETIVVPTGDFTAQTRSTDLYTQEMN